MLTLLACAASPIAVHDEKPTRDPQGIEELPGGTEVEDTATEPYEGDDAWIFDDARIHDIEVTLDDHALDALAAEPYTYVHGDFTIDGETVATVGVRLRGKVGSFRTMDGKPKFKIDFGEFVDGQKFYGLKGLALNNEVVDCSYLKEPLAYRVFREAGVPAGRTGFARVTVNGAAYGLYVIIEVPDDRFVKAHYADGSGNLYDGKYLYDWHTGNYSLIDFIPTMQDNFQLEEGEDVGLEDIRAITRALRDTDSLGFSVVDTLVDMDELRRNWAAEQFVGHVDGYAMNQNNYRVYFDPEDGRAEIIPWDFDYAFIEDYAWGMSWSSPRGRLASKCWADADCVAAQGEAVRTLLDGLDVAALATALSDWQALIATDAHTDPRRECSVGSIDSEQAALAAWIDGRSGSMRSSWGL